MTQEAKNYIASEDFIEGFKCLELGVPWQVPESIYHENYALDENDIVFEVGTGGSTLFVSRICKEVIAIETSVDWAEKVEDKLFEDNMDKKIIYMTMQAENDIVDFIKVFNTSTVTVLSVDTQGGYNRSRILDAFLKKDGNYALRMIILDNYGHEGLFPDHWDKNIDLGKNWDVFTYDHPRWAGGGTKIYIKK